MVDKNDSVKKTDLELILEVNRKAIQIEVKVSEQNETIIELLEDYKEDNQKIIDKVNEVKKETDKLSELNSKINEIEKHYLTIKITIGTGVIGLLLQLVWYFVKK